MYDLCRSECVGNVMARLVLYECCTSELHVKAKVLSFSSAVIQHAVLSMESLIKYEYLTRCSRTD